MEWLREQLSRASPAKVRYLTQPCYTPPSEVGHWVRTAGILSPLIIGEVAKDPEKKWRFVRIRSMAVALISGGLHAHRISGSAGRGRPCGSDNVSPLMDNVNEAQQLVDLPDAMEKTS